LTAGLNEEGEGAKEDGEEKGEEGVRGPGDRMGRRWDLGDSEATACLGNPGSGIAKGAGLAFATGPTDVFLKVSVSAAKLSAVVMDGEVDGGEESEVIESDDGDLLLLRRCTGRGAGTGGLEARAPWGRSITRSGVCLGFRFVAAVVEVRDSQNPRKP